MTSSPPFSSEEDSTLVEIDWLRLERVAIETRQRAHAPYSKYFVGAAILGSDGLIHRGCNVENASYGLTICAERSAAVSMVAAGCKKIQGVVVVTAGPKAGSPCGACRQVLFELCEDAPLIMLAVDEKNEVIDRRHSSIVQLLPDGFRLL
ncbi:MAG: cytidine deaminase [Polyangiaceae bacterium]